MKIFGVGLPKTGSISLFYAMKMLGFECKHFLHYKDTDTDKKLKSSIEPFDFVNDTPICYVYRKLDKLFPNSKYIWITRNFDSWIGSCKLHFKIENDNYHRIALFGSYFFNYKQFQKIYYHHYNDLIDFSKTNKVLHFNIEDEDHIKWSKLYEFLNLNKPSTFPNFPFKNTKNNKMKTDI